MRGRRWLGFGSNNLQSNCFSSEIDTSSNKKTTNYFCDVRLDACWIWTANTHIAMAASHDSASIWTELQKQVFKNKVSSKETEASDIWLKKILNVTKCHKLDCT